MYPLHYFAEKYQTYQNYELLEIIRNPSQYQSLAIQAAKNELNSRELSPSELEAATVSLQEKNNHKSSTEQRIKDLSKKISAATECSLDYITPTENRITAADKLKVVIALIYSVIFIVNAKTHYQAFRRVNFEDKDYVLFLVLDTIPTFVLLVSLCFFWPGRRFGWYLLILFIGSNLFSLFASMYFNVTSSDNEYFAIARTSPIIYFILGLFYIGTLITLYRSDVMSIFGIQSKKHWPWGVGFMLGMLYYLFMAGF